MTGYIIYNCGYKLSYSLFGPKTGKKYKFMRRMVTKVEDADYGPILALTADDVPWCSQNSKELPPFMSLEDWCGGQKGRYDSKPFKIYNPQLYLANMLVK